MAILQLALGALNWSLMAAVIFTLLPSKLDYPLVLGVLLISAIAGVITHIPAGLGVLEAVFVALDGRLAGLVAVADPIKPTAEAAIRDLHDLGIKVIMATGDNERTALAVASRLGIDEVRAGMLPEGKKDLIDGLRGKGNKVAMAGDGVNDAPALKAADIGCAMGKGGTQVAQNGIVTSKGAGRQTVAVLGRFSVLPAERGTVRYIGLQGYQSSGAGNFQQDYQSQLCYEWEFTERLA